MKRRHVTVQIGVLTPRDTHKSLSVSDYIAKRAPFRGLHLEHVRRAYERGELVLAGALADPADGAVLVFNGPSPDKAEAFAKADPYVTNGLVTGWRVRKWMTVVGEGSRPPHLR